MKILFICSSNVCRSPYCEIMFKKIVSENVLLKEADIQISSSAVFNRSKQLFPMAEVALKAEGFSDEELAKFKPSFKSDSKEKFEAADVIIGMSRMHKLLTPKKYRNKVFTLSEIAINCYNKIPDPFLASSQEKYNEVMAIIKEYLYIYADNLQRQIFDAKTAK